MTIKIVLADDHTIVRHALCESIQSQSDMEVIGQAHDGLSAIQLIRQLLPDVVVMDISMPNLNGIEATREIIHDFPDMKSIALSMHSAKKFVAEMFRAGAKGYLLKDCDMDELAEAIRVVCSGNVYLSPSVTGAVVESSIKAAPQQEPSAFHALTRREREVLQLMAEGKTTKQIGISLHISPKTVEAHRLRVMDKLDIDNIAQLTKYAIQEGLTSPEP
ncbi:MAG: response regulator transcription factor [Planctomycetaceae bacterium]|nr:response regulator transcription factor [Planctomycetaceae bacterium]